MGLIVDEEGPDTIAPDEVEQLADRIRRDTEQLAADRAVPPAVLAMPMDAAARAADAMTRGGGPPAVVVVKWVNLTPTPHYGDEPPGRTPWAGDVVVVVASSSPYRGDSGRVAVVAGGRVYVGIRHVGCADFDPEDLRLFAGARGVDGDFPHAGDLVVVLEAFPAYGVDRFQLGRVRGHRQAARDAPWEILVETRGTAGRIRGWLPMAKVSRAGGACEGDRGLR